MLNESGLSAIAETAKNVVKGDAEAVGSLAAVVVSVVVAKRVIGKPGSAAAEAGEVSTARSSPVGGEFKTMVSL